MRIRIFCTFLGAKLLIARQLKQRHPRYSHSILKKTVNTQVALEGRDKLGSYLWGFREKLGRWKINSNVYPLIASEEGFSYITITYSVETIDRAEAIHLIVIAVLKVDADKKIVEVFEVDHSIEMKNPQSR